MAKFQSVNQVAKEAVVQLTEVDIRDRTDAIVRLTDDVIGWMEPALDPVACEHDVDALSEHIMYCTKCGQVRQVEFR